MAQKGGGNRAKYKKHFNISLELNEYKFDRESPKMHM